MHPRMGPRAKIVKGRGGWRSRSSVLGAAAALMALPWLVALLGAGPRRAPAAPPAAPPSFAEQVHVAERPWADDPPKWCADLIAHPREGVRRPPHYRDCARGNFGAVCEDGRPRFFSQFNQDIWTWTNHWRFLRRRGVYLDIAANEPVKISNSYFFDRCLGWRGLCVEGNPRYVSLLRSRRSCSLTPTCVSDRTENVTFVLSAGRGGVQGTNKNAGKPGQRDAASARLTCVRTADAIAAAGFRRIDMLSLDVEGHELKVLQGIDWPAVRINMVILESGRATQDAAEFLRGMGYRIAAKSEVLKDVVVEGTLYNDHVFIRHDVELGKPV